MDAGMVGTVCLLGWFYNWHFLAQPISNEKGWGRKVAWWLAPVPFSLLVFCGFFYFR